MGASVLRQILRSGFGWISLPPDGSYLSLSHTHTHTHFAACGERNHHPHRLPHAPTANQLGTSSVLTLNPSHGIGLTRATPPPGSGVKSQPATLPPPCCRTFALLARRNESGGVPSARNSVGSPSA
jgi:hypothetical protein